MIDMTKAGQFYWWDRANKGPLKPMHRFQHDRINGKYAIWADSVLHDDAVCCQWFEEKPGTDEECLEFAKTLVDLAYARRNT